MRVIVAGITHESNTFNPIVTTMDQFLIFRGNELLSERPPVPRAFFQGSANLFWTPAKTLQSIGIDVLPILFARAHPSGPVQKDTYLSLKTEILERTRKADIVDGICLILHGAMTVDGIGSAELDLIKSLRETVGESVIISASLDMHANMPEEIVNYANILTAYREFPHYDIVETRRKAARLLIEAINKGVRPYCVIVKPPVLIPGENVVTKNEPAASFYQRLKKADSIAGIMDSSFLVGCYVADVPYAGASAITVAESRKYLKEAYQQTVELAKVYWERRAEFQLGESGTLQEVVQIAKASKDKPFLICDSGDNVSAGGSGDVPIMLKELITQGIGDAVVGGMVDRDAVEACRSAGVGTVLTLDIGGKVDKVNGYPLKIRGEVINVTTKGVVFRVEGIDIIITSQIRAFRSREDFLFFGIDPLDRKIVVVKLGQLLPGLETVAAKSMIAITPGLTDLRTQGFDYKNLRRPIFPLDKNFDWSPYATGKG